MECFVYCLPLIFAVLHRGRGDDFWFLEDVDIGPGLCRVFMGVSIALLASNEWWSYLLFIVLYFMGEKPGWGLWQGGIVNHAHLKRIGQNADINLIVQLNRSIKDLPFFEKAIHDITNALKFYHNKEPLSYCYVSLFIRGLWWWLPITAALSIMVKWWIAFFVFPLALGFPASNYIATLFRSPSNYRFYATRESLTRTEAWWALSEVIYGVWIGCMFTTIFLLR